ncbi:MAG: LptF/LptG family permease, partial [Campylobacterales bacterium]|nr:LptF/LptG family permease [Campylobacterales bacterium]
MLAYRYISLHFLKYFIIILTALTLFLLGLDYMENADDLNSSANLLLIYMVYKSFFSIDMLLPISLVFAMVSTKLFLIRTNALVSFYSLGYSRVDILKPFIAVSSFIIFIYISMHSISAFSRSEEFSKNIRDNAEYLSPTRDLFFTYKKQFVYFSKLSPIQKRAEGIRVFEIQDGLLKEVLVAKLAVYKNDYWYIKEGDVITKPDDMSFISTGITVTTKNDLRILHEFKPIMIDQVYEGKVNFTIFDAIDAYKLLSEQNLPTQTIKIALYKIFIYPFFAPALIVIIFFFVPISVRFLNVSLFAFLAILSTLLIWCFLFMLGELANNKTLSGEVGIVLPVILLLFIAIRQYRYHA